MGDPSRCGECGVGLCDCQDPDQPSEGTIIYLEHDGFLNPVAIAWLCVRCGGCYGECELLPMETTA